MVTGMQGHRARSALSGGRFAQLTWVAETGSTNADALAQARAGTPDGLVVVADHQTAGRGRRDRSWEAAPGAALLVSVLLRPDLAPADAHLAGTAVGVAAAEACWAVAGVDVGLKWPNDLVAAGPDADTDAYGGAVGVGGLKLGGILAESLVAGDELQAVVVGLGLNVDWPDGPPPDLAGRAAALAQLAGHPVDREDLLVALLARLEGWLSDLGGAGVGRGQPPAARQRLVDRARQLSATIGARVRVEQVDRTYEGTALDVTDDGRLLVAPDGEPAGSPPVAVAVADVVHLRPA
jgi:BirA family biotin operon repressor/biotin-[acetyl-CoA-carboxylase] ligase